MPDKPLTVLTYAASASLAAVALVYLFNPSYLFDAVVPGGAAAVMAGDPRIRGGRGRAVGLANPANDCFINSVLQALAGLGGLELYLARELASRDADERDEKTGEGKIYAYRSPESLEEEEDGEEEEEAQRGGETATAVTTGKRKRSGQRAEGVPGAGLNAEWRAQATERKARSLLAAEVTRGLKAMLDQLNDRSSEPAQRHRVITAAPFVAALESAFATRVNRNQQDAQELLQVVAERMSEEYAAGKAARERARRRGVPVPDPLTLLAKQRMRERQEKKVERSGGDDEKGAAAVRDGQITEQADASSNSNPETSQEKTSEQHQQEAENDMPATVPAPTTTVLTTRLNGESIPAQMLHGRPTNDASTDISGSSSIPSKLDDLLDGEGFPLQGQTKHQIECQHCGFIPSSKPTDFIMLTLPVPPTRSSTTLDDCLDQFSKPEYIDDYKCDRCRLEHAIQLYETELGRSSTASERATQLRDDILPKLKHALDNDPESPPEGVKLPDSKLAPARRIARSVRITSFPRVLVVHLSRSAFDPGAESSKNTAKVVFPEHLALGSLADRRKYRLLGLVTHKGTHDSGHYETFRRQHAYEISVADLADAAGTVEEEMEREEGDDAGVNGSNNNSSAKVAAVVSGGSAAAVPEVRSSISPSDGSDPEMDRMVDGKGRRDPSKAGAASGTATPTPSSTSTAIQQQPSRRSISRRRNPFTRHSREHSRSSPRAAAASPPPGSTLPSSSGSGNTPDPISEVTDSSKTTTHSSDRTLASTQPSTNDPSITNTPNLSNPSNSLDVPRPSFDALAATAATTPNPVSGSSSAAAAQAPAMERASSRQRMRDRMEEAKERKREKRLRRLVARENARWWRISDDKVRECRSGDVLGMMKEVYLLFYEME